MSYLEHKKCYCARIVQRDVNVNNIIISNRQGHLIDFMPSSLGNSNQRHTVFLRESRRGYGNIYLASLMKQLYPKEVMADDATNYLLA